MLDICLWIEKRPTGLRRERDADVPVLPSPAAARAAQVLKMLAATPDQDLSLSELARRVGLNRTTCQTLLLALTAEGLVVRREPQPTYRLGPVLIHLGEAAKASLDVVDLVGAELDTLHDDLGVTAMAGITTNDEIVIAAVRAAEHPFGLTPVTGGRLPLRAPIGPVYVAWADDGTIDAWLERAKPPLTQGEEQRQREGLARIRHRGYSATVEVPDRGGSRRARRGARHEELVETDLAATAPLSVIGVSAPVWHGDGSLACSIAVSAFSADLTLRELAAAGDAVGRSAARVTALLGGRAPADDSSA
jgi:DNA-binding IclR family transcriptional regulator